MRYKKIIIALKDTEEDAILTKQADMLSERHDADIVRLDPSGAESYMIECDDIVVVISDDQDLLAKAKTSGIPTNDPQKMKKAYAQAMNMLKNMTQTDPKK